MRYCPKCQKPDLIKDGFTKGKQRYKCKICSHRTIFSTNTYHSNVSIKRQALHLYLEGLGFRSIGRILKFSHVSIYRWIKSFGEKLKNIQKKEKAAIKVEIDEMHTYVKKKTQNGYGYLLIELEKSSLILLSVEEIQKQDSNYGKRQKIKK